MSAHVIFVLICYLIDGILMIFFPSSFLLNSTMFIPCLGLSAMILTVRKFERIDACLFACCFGMFYDFFYAHEFLTYALIYTFIAFVVQIWSRHMMDTVVELLVLCISTIFVKEAVVYFLMILESRTNMDIMSWFVNREFMTLVGNALLVGIVIFLIRIKDDFLQIRESRIRKEEKIEWTKLLSRH